MRGMARNRTSIVDLCVQRGMEVHGVVKGCRVGARVSLFVAQWCEYIDKHDGAEPPSVLQFAQWAGRPSVSCDRAMAEFRELFREYDTPRAFVGVPLTSGGRGVPGTAGRDAVAV